jgi:hypothetical protein
MGRTLLGVDLDESHVGELVKRLLTDEELEKLADGGRPAGDDRDGSDADSDDSDDTDDHGDDTGTGSGTDTDTDTDTDTGSSETGGSSVGVGSATGSVGGRDWTGTDDTDWLDDGDDEGRLGGYGPLVLKGGAVLLVLVVVGLVVWRYGGRVKGALPSVGGSGTSDEGDVADDEPAASGTDEGVSPARRRAKVGVRDDGEDAGGGTDSGGSRVDAGGEGRRRGEPGVEAVGRDVDLGALVGLGTLALVAALVRKFGEQRPRDPLVDGPSDEE